MSEIIPIENISLSKKIESALMCAGQQISRVFWQRWIRLVRARLIKIRHRGVIRLNLVARTMLNRHPQVLVERDGVFYMPAISRD